jgi:hypothetical protein
MHQVNVFSGRSGGSERAILLLNGSQFPRKNNKVHGVVSNDPCTFSFSKKNTTCDHEHLEQESPAVPLINGGSLTWMVELPIP